MGRGHAQFVSKFSERLSPVLTGVVRRGYPPHNPFLAFSLPCEMLTISMNLKKLTRTSTGMLAT
jgi:hypothetical protein